MRHKLVGSVLRWLQAYLQYCQPSTHMCRTGPTSRQRLARAAQTPPPPNRLRTETRLGCESGQAQSYLAISSQIDLTTHLHSRPQSQRTGDEKADLEHLRSSEQNWPGGSTSLAMCGPETRYTGSAHGFQDSGLRVRAGFCRCRGVHGSGVWAVLLGLRP